jgi:hypothetical protein
MNFAVISNRRDPDVSPTMTNVADQIVAGLNRSGWDLCVSGFSRASGETCWIVFGTRGQESLHSDGLTPTEALLKAARLAAH